MPRTTIRGAASRAKRLLSKEKLLNAEVGFFRGLSIFLVVMLVIIFLSFSALFGFMYMETKMIRLQLARVYTEISPYRTEVIAADNDTSTAPETDQTEINIDDWQSFSKYGFSVKFPADWTYRDNPYGHRVDFFTDGVVRGLESSAAGSFNINLTEKDNFIDQGYDSELLYVAGQPARKYVSSIHSSAPEGSQYIRVVVPGGTGYYELNFMISGGNDNLIAPEIVEKILDNFTLVQ
ncbi:TPA: hypothetical protein DF272_02280 [Candidatus Falkowbacteria bacterium]|nr:hypothetical protein [Candidatus Falkowbacteria bacterium]